MGFLGHFAQKQHVARWEVSEGTGKDSVCLMMFEKEESRYWKKEGAPRGLIIPSSSLLLFILIHSIFHS